MALTIKNGVLVKYAEEPFETEVIVPNGVIEIGKGAFQECRSLRSVILPDSVQSIGDYAFERCQNLVSVKFGNGLKRIEWLAFMYCESLAAVHFPAVAGDLGGDFTNCTGLKEVWFSGEDTRLDPIAFNACESLEYIKLYPDDPVMRRNYYKDCYKLAEHINQTLDMFRCGDYTAKIPTIVKYPLTILHYLRTHDEGSSAFIQKNITRIVKESIRWGDTEFLRDITENTDWLPKKQLDSLIELAAFEHRTEIGDMLVQYKAEHSVG